MFSNSGSLSFYLGVGFIAIALVGFVAVTALVVRSTIAGEKIQTLIELGKWVLTSVAIVVGASIVSDSFKERDQDIKEFGIYDKYVETVTAADGIEKRYELAEYFATVAPDGELRKAWGNYKELIKPKLEEYRAKKGDLQNLKQKGTLTEADVQKKAELELATSSLEQSIIQRAEPPPDSGKAFVIIAASDSSLEQAKAELVKARRLNPDARIYKKGDWFLTVIPSFRSRNDASEKLDEIRRAVRGDAYVVEEGKLCTKLDVAGEYLACS